MRKHLSEAKLEENFDLGYHLKHVDTIFERVFGKTADLVLRTRESLVEAWTIGRVNVTRVEEQIGFASLPPERFLVGFERELLQRHLAWLAPDHYSPEHDRLVTSVHSWLIRTNRDTILVDCCAGNHKERPSSARSISSTRRIWPACVPPGTAPEDIDIVLERICTRITSLEHHAPRRPLGADLSQCQVSVLAHRERNRES